LPSGPYLSTDDCGGDANAWSGNLQSAAILTRFVLIVVTGRKKARRICQKVHIKIKTKSKQYETL
jgi:hypothetical protein